MCKLICVTSLRLCRDDFIKRIKEIADSPVDKIILREKQLSECEYECLAESVLCKCKENRDKIVLHNYWAVAKRLGCKSVHLPFSVFKDFDSHGYFNKISTSAHSLEQAEFAQNHGASFITAGHIFKTNCKKGLEPRGTEFLENICKNVEIPVYAIGGINADTVGALKNIKQRNFAGVCVMSEFMTAENVRKLAETLKKELESYD